MVFFILFFGKTRTLQSNVKLHYYKSGFTLCHNYPFRPMEDYRTVRLFVLSQTRTISPVYNYLKYCMLNTIGCTATIVIIVICLSESQLESLVIKQSTHLGRCKLDWFSYKIPCNQYLH